MIIIYAARSGYMEHDEQISGQALIINNWFFSNSLTMTWVPDSLVGLDNDEDQSSTIRWNENTGQLLAIRSYEMFTLIWVNVFRTGVWATYRLIIPELRFLLSFPTT